jgi:hypothetical protein
LEKKEIFFNFAPLLKRQNKQESSLREREGKVRVNTNKATINYNGEFDPGSG